MLAKGYANNVIAVADIFLSPSSVPGIVLRLHLCEPHDAELRPKVVQVFDDNCWRVLSPSYYGFSCTLSHLAQGLLLYMISFSPHCNATGISEACSDCFGGRTLTKPVNEVIITRHYCNFHHNNHRALSPCQALISTLHAPSLIFIIILWRCGDYAPFFEVEESRIWRADFM